MSRSNKWRTNPKYAYELEPSPHPTEPDTYCVPIMRRKYGDYRLYISRNTARFYDENTLPDFIKAQLAMISVREPLEPLRTDAVIHGKGLYKHLYDRTTPELGWRLSPSYYVLVISKQQLDILDSPCDF